MQSRLTNRHGLILGAVATAPLFFGQHLPLVLASGGGPVAMLVLSAVFIMLAIFFRYAVGATLIDTTGSLLVVGIMHASSDAAGSAFGNGWQQLLAAVPVALLVLAYRAIRRRSLNTRTSPVEPVPVPADPPTCRGGAPQCAAPLTADPRYASIARDARPQWISHRRSTGTEGTGHSRVRSPISLPAIPPKSVGVQN